jgi:SAM-dependent methyltransferase
VPKLLDSLALERSPIVANRRMNRERGLVGGNSYTKDLGMSPLDWLTVRLRAVEQVVWVDLCCGSGRALVEAALELRALGLAERVSVVGVDLVGMFTAVPAGLSHLQLVETSVTQWSPGCAVDLVTCVHGLHYVGDKLGVVARASGWLTAGGLLRANFDAASLQVEGCAKALVVRELKRAGLQYDARRRLLSAQGPMTHTLPFSFVGADDTAGPNYTGQPAVDAHYRRS